MGSLSLSKMVAKSCQSSEINRYRGAAARRGGSYSYIPFPTVLSGFLNLILFKFKAFSSIILSAESTIYGARGKREYMQARWWEGLRPSMVSAMLRSLAN